MARTKATARRGIPPFREFGRRYKKPVEENVGEESLKTRRKNKPFTVPKDPKIRAMFKENAIKSPLLRLPQELIDKIVDLVFEPEILHIRRRTEEATNRYWSDYHWTSLYGAEWNEYARPGAYWETAYSLDSNAEEKAFRAFENGSPMRPLRSKLCDYSLIGMDLSFEARAEKPPRQSAHLSLFRTCRALYGPLTQAFWTRTMFSFHHTYTFQAFMANRTPAQKAWIRNLRFTTSPSASHHMDLPWPLVQSLTGLRVLYLHIFEMNYMTSMVRPATYPAGIMRLATLPLETVKIICDTPLPSSWGGPTDYTPEHCAYELQKAHVVRDRFLDAEHTQQLLRERQRNSVSARILRAKKAKEISAGKRKCALITRAKCDEHKRGLVEGTKKKVQVCFARHRCRTCRRWEYGSCRSLKGGCECSSSGATSASDNENPSPEDSEMTME